MTTTISRQCLSAARVGMTQPHPARAQGAPTTGWGIAPQQPMGAMPHDNAIPEWFEGPRDFGGWWLCVVPWFVVYEAEGGNPAPEASVRVSMLDLWLRRGDGVWYRQQQAAPSWANAYGMSGGKLADVVVPRDALGAVCQPRDGYKIHGGGARTALPLRSGAPDVYGAFVGVTHALHGGAGRYVVQAGIDWWPQMDTQVSAFAPAAYNPGACSGPMTLSTTAASHAHAVTER